MNWRALFVAMSLLGAVLLNGALVVYERIPQPDGDLEVIRVDEVLRHIQYTASTRRNNFKEMGMSDDLADASASQIDRLMRKKKVWVELLSEQAAEVGPAFCPTTGLPQPYAALRFIVKEENERREVIDPERLTLFEEQPWFVGSPVDSIYAATELTTSRKADATVMGVSAVLLRKEEDLLDRMSPWSTGIMGTWGVSPLMEEYPTSRRLVIEYFALMHYLTELANTRDGICG